MALCLSLLTLAALRGMGTPRVLNSRAMVRATMARDMAVDAERLDAPTTTEVALLELLHSLPPPPPPALPGESGDGGDDDGDADVTPAMSFLDRHPILAKALSMGITYSLADAAAQAYGRVHCGERESWDKRIQRNLGLMLVGLVVVGPLLSIWFDWLDAAVPGTTARAVASRTIIDQLVQAPVIMSLIFVLSGLAEGHSLDFCAAKVRHKLVPTWRGCVGVWTPVQFVNQGVVPLQHRVAFQAFVSFFWDAYMSICAHSEVPSTHGGGERL